MASTLAAIKAASHAKDAREKRDTDFHKTALVLAREYLRANGYSKSCGTPSRKKWVLGWRSSSWRTTST